MKQSPRPFTLANTFSYMTGLTPTLPNSWPRPRALQLELGYAVEGSRDLRLDLLRGFAAFAMVVDHLGGASYLYAITGGNGFFVSAAEAFIFISGVVVGIVYGGIAIRDGLRTAAGKALERAWVLYRLTVVLTLLFAGISLWFHLPWADTIKADDPWSFAWNVVTLRQTMYLGDIPLLYTFMMFFAPLGLWLLLKGRTSLLLVLSTAIWLGFQIAPASFQLPWPILGNSIFNIGSWQLLFFWAMALGFHRRKLSRWFAALPRLPYFVFSLTLFGLLLQLYQVRDLQLTHLLPGVDTAALIGALFMKNSVAVGRLLASAVVFQAAFLAVTLLWRPIVTLFGWLLLPLGQNALYAYTMHVLLIGLLYSALPLLPVPLMEMGLANTAFQLAVVLLIWAMIQRRFAFRVIPR